METTAPLAPPTRPGTRHRFASIVLGLLWLAAWSWATAAGTPPASALILGVHGKVSPAVQPFSEVQANSLISLTPEGELDFLLYQGCERVQVRGGSLRFGKENYEINGGQVIKSQRGACPFQARLADNPRAAGVVLRNVTASLPQTLRLSPRPQIRLLGPGAEEVRALSIGQAGMPRWESRVDRLVASWSKDWPSLIPGESCRLRLLSDNRRSGEIPCIVAEEELPEATLLRIP